MRNSLSLGSPLLLWGGSPRLHTIISTAIKTKPGLEIARPEACQAFLPAGWEQGSPAGCARLLCLPGIILLSQPLQYYTLPLVQLHFPKILSLSLSPHGSSTANNPTHLVRPLILPEPEQLTLPLWKKLIISYNRVNITLRFLWTHSMATPKTAYYTCILYIDSSYLIIRPSWQTSLIHLVLDIQ